MSTPIEQFLQQFKGEEILYFPNPGNAGDSVIAAATYQMFNRLGLTYSTPRLERCNVNNRIVIYGGGGNLVGPNTHSTRFAQLVHAQAKRFVILPHTVKEVTPLLEAFGPNVDIICREAVSYQYAAQAAPRAHVHLMDDVAFSLDVQSAMNGTSIASPLKRLLSYLVAKSFLSVGVPALHGVLRAFHLGSMRAQISDREISDELYCFRTDGEKTDIPIPPSNIDLSEHFKFGVESADIAYLSAREVLCFLSKFKVIHTNRLHMAVSGALLGLDVRFYTNDYYKCRAVYEQSMKNQFKNVRWIG